jgi:hypothetical protein
MYFDSQNGASAVLRVLNSVTTWTNRRTVASLNLEQDNTLSLYCGKLICNTSSQPINAFDWNFIQLNLVFGVSLTGTILCTAEIVVNGLTCAYGSGDSGINISDMPDGLADVNQLELLDPGANWAWAYAQVRDWTAAQGIPSGQVAIFPWPGTPPGGNARVSQAVLETSEQVTTQNARVSHAVMEFSEGITDTQNARVSHICIELMLASQLQNYTGIWGVTKPGDNAMGYNAVGLF